MYFFIVLLIETEIYQKLPLPEVQSIIMMLTVYIKEDTSSKRDKDRIEALEIWIQRETKRFKMDSQSEIANRMKENTSLLNTIIKWKGTGQEQNWLEGTVEEIEVYR